MDPVNLSEVLIYDIVILLDYRSKRGSPYKSTSVLILSDRISKFRKAKFTLIIRLIQFCEK